MSMLNSEQIHAELNKLNLILEQGKNHPSYAYEHPLDQEKFLYVKRKKDTPINKAPLVLYPESITLRSLIDRIAGLEVTWNKTKSTSYRRNPKDNGTSQYGYDANVSTSKALYDLISVLTGSAPQYKATAIDASLLASKKKDAPVNSLNQILYGPPGTGKTYATTEMAVKVAEPLWYEDTCAALVGTELSTIELRRVVKEKYDQLVEEQRIMFTTFHQSFSYEDFIEGIRANTDGQSNALNYGIEDGIFKRLCTMADVQVQAAPTDEINLHGRKIWKMSLGNTLEDEDYIFDECITNDYVLLGYGDNIDFSGCDKRSQVKEKLELAYNKPIESNNYSLTSVHTFKNIMKVGDLIVVSDGNHKFRAIAEITDDYEFLDTDERVGYQQLRRVKWLRQYQPSQPKERLFLKSLSQMTLYELKSTTVDHEKLEKLLAPTEIQAAEHKPHVLIIDEINRGNISRIFGELITLLEPSKRKGADDAQTVYLPYSKKTFSVPDNLYVIGTMNTADKSLAQLDLALRRRFSFVEMLPQTDLLKNVEVFGVNLAQMLTKINQRIEVLLDAEHLIGHSYFMPLLSIDDEVELQVELAKLFENKLLPLLQEYFFDDYQRIGWILNVPEPGKHPDEHYFILTDKAQEDSLPKLHELFAPDVAEQLMDRRYRINKKAFNNPEAYKSIVA